MRIEPDHLDDFCEEYDCVGCERTRKTYVEHYPIANEYPTVQEFDRRRKFTGKLARWGVCPLCTITLPI